MYKPLITLQKYENIEVDKENVIEYLSHIGLKLERMLAFVHTKSKSITNEDIILKGRMKNESQDLLEMYRPPAWLGLNPRTVPFDDTTEENEDVVAEETN